MNDLVQSGFFDMEPVRTETIIVTNLEILSKEDLLREANTYHNSLDLEEQQLEAIVQFANEQRKNVIVAKGELYQLMKDRLSYAEWVDWLKGIRVAISTANEYIKYNVEYHQELTATPGSSISRKKLRAIHHSGEGHEILAKLERGEIKPDAINAEIEAAKQRAKDAELVAKQAREAVQIAQQQVFEMELQAKEAEKQLGTQEREARKAVDALTEQIELLNQQIAAIPEPKVEIREVEKVPQKTLEEIEELHKLLAQLTYERDNEAARAETFAKKFREDLSAHKEDEQRERTRQRWHTITADFQSVVMRTLSQWPTALDTQSFDFRDWARLDQMEETANRFLQECRNIRQRNSTMIIDAGDTD